VHEILQKVRAALTTVCRPKLRCCSSAPTGAIGLIAYPPATKLGDGALEDA
jgi:hypothetical protein